MSFIDDWKEWSTAKKVISILVVCCIGILIIGALTGGGSPDKNTATTSSSNNNNNSTAESGSYIKITYSGSWSGALSTGGSTKSISGSGEEKIDIKESGMVSVNAQKQDASSRELTVQIVKDGKIVEEATTDAEYGVAQVSGFI
jgi:cytoskeletal protein RodZ